MYREYTQKEFWKLYCSLPLKLKDVLFADETGNNLEKICKRHQVEDKFSEVLNLVGQVLLGLLPVGELEKVLVRDVKLSMAKAKEMSREIIRFIFFPVKDELTRLYEMTSSSENIFKEEEGEDSSVTSKDTYREIIE